MKVREAMTRDVRLIEPNQTIQQAARIMADIDAGAVPVSLGDKLVGIITDRDIAVRAVADGKGPDTPISEVMTSEIKYCFDDDDLDKVVANMGDIQVRRLPVVDRDKRLVGIVSLGDIAASAKRKDVGEAVADISRPGGAHSQATPARG